MATRFQRSLEESGGSSCSSGPGRPCGQCCAFKWDVIIGDWDVVQLCEDPDKRCTSPPPPSADFIEESDRVACQPCYLENQVMPLARALPAELVTKRFTVTLRSVRDPRVVGRVDEFVVPGGTGQVFSRNFGWLVKAQNHLQKRQHTSVEPTNLPVTFPQDRDEATAIGLELQEGDSFNQYWVNVAKSAPWCWLRTPEWDVLTVRLPL